MSGITRFIHFGQQPENGEALGERRATDQLLKAWKPARDKRSVLDSVRNSSLWDHCFLFVYDENAKCSVILDCGDRAAKGLGLEDNDIKSLSLLPEEISKRIHGLGHECREKQTAVVDADELDDAADVPVKRYRMALVPLAQPEEAKFFPRHDLMNMLGVFTYQ